MTDDILPICPDGSVPQSVLLFSRIDFAWLNPILMERLRARHQTRFVIVPPSVDWVEFYRPHCGERDRQILATDIVAAADAEDPSAGPADTDRVFARAAELEARYGVAYLRDIMQQCRTTMAYHLDYAPDSPFAARRPPPLEQVTRQINGFFAYFETLFDEEQIDLVVERPGDLLSTVCLLVAQARGIPTTFWLPARFQSYVTWSDGPYLGHRLIRAVYDRLPAPEPVALDTLQPPDDSKRNFARADTLRSFPNLLKNLYVETRNYTAKEIKLRLEGRRRTGLPYRAMMRHHVAVWRAHRRLLDMVESDVDRIRARPFVLFLLQFEPEYTTLSLSRRFNDTRAALQQIALSLPAGTRLVVKENVNSVGNRGLGFYRRLMRLPNVILADHRIRGIDLMMHAGAVATVSSTGALEANLTGRPAVVVAGDLEFGFLPDVHRIDGFDDLPALMRYALRPLSDRERETIRVRASKYREALKAVSFRAPETRPFRGGKTTLPDGEADRAVDRLIDCYRLQLREAEREVATAEEAAQ